jgi:hypothetical protein
MGPHAARARQQNEVVIKATHVRIERVYRGLARSYALRMSAWPHAIYRCFPSLLIAMVLLVGCQSRAVPPREVDTSQTRLASEILFPSGPWRRERRVQLGESDEMVTERSEATAADETGAWTIHTTQRDDDADAWRDVQRVTISRSSEGGTLVHSLWNASRKSRVEFTPPLVLAPATIGAAEHRATADVRNIADGGRAKKGESGRAEANATAFVTETGLAAAKVTLTLWLGPAKIVRVNEVWIEDASQTIVRDQSELTVWVGPLRWERSVRMWEAAPRKCAS